MSMYVTMTSKLSLTVKPECGTSCLGYILVALRRAIRKRCSGSLLHFGLCADDIGAFTIAR